jgi:hypothetical protein
MRIAAALTAAFVLTGAALADQPWDKCQEPFGPLAPDPATATAEVMREAKQEVETFMRNSDAYQDCLIRVMNDRDVKDEEDKLTPGQKAHIQRKIDSNQRLKETVGAEYNEAVRAYNARIGAATPKPAGQ